MGSGRGGNNRRKPFRRRDRNNDAWQDSSRRGERRPADPGRPGEAARFEQRRGGIYERPQWTPPKLSTGPLPAPECPWCGKPIKDISAAITDKNSGKPLHFDCVLEYISGGEKLERGDEISYIGGGRFGIVHFSNFPDNQKRSGESRNFVIKKIFEWEDKENRAEWRQSISDYYSVT
jgi:hypothetical protein